VSIAKNTDISTNRYYFGKAMNYLDISCDQLKAISFINLSLNIIFENLIKFPGSVETIFAILSSSRSENTLKGSSHI